MLLKVEARSSITYTMRGFSQATSGMLYRKGRARLQIKIVLEVDLLQGMHVAQHARHGGERVLFEANGAKVRQPRQAHGQAIIRDAVVGQVQDAQAQELLHLIWHRHQLAPARM